MTKRKFLREESPVLPLDTKVVDKGVGDEGVRIVLNHADGLANEIHDSLLRCRGGEFHY